MCFLHPQPTFSSALECCLQTAPTHITTTSLILNPTTEHLLDAVRTALDAVPTPPSAAVAETATKRISAHDYLRRFLMSAAEKCCVRVGSSCSPASVLSTLSNWFLVLQSPVLAPREMQPYEVVASQVVESPHPYLNSQDLTHQIEPSDKSLVSSIEYMEVTFDPRCRTENQCDYLAFYKDGVRQGLSKCDPFIPSHKVHAHSFDRLMQVPRQRSWPLGWSWLYGIAQSQRLLDGGPLPF